MNCPTDGTVLVMSERQGVEIDYCPTCRGVWLDRGELDKILERSAALGAAAPSPAVTSPGPQDTPPGGYAATPYQAAPYDDRTPRDRPSGDRPYDPRYDDSRRYDDDRRRHDSRDQYRDSRGYPRKKKESWLGEIFDF